jgi:ATP-dependent DNA helicase RecG
MLYNYPRRYDDYTQLRPINRLFYGEEVTVIASVQSVNLRPIRRGQGQIVEVIVDDGSGALRINWFNQPWIGKRLQIGMPVVLSGKIDQYLGRLVMNNPELEPLEQQNLHTNRIVPVYSLTENITQRWLRKQMYQVVTYWAPRIPDHLPDSIRKAANLLDLPTALLQVHFPDSMEKLRSARQRLAFDEIFFLQLGVLRQKHTWQNRSARVFMAPDEWIQTQIDCLPFSLTAAQQRVLNDLRLDMASGHPMNRLLQGDVGSGKTVIAALAIAVLARQGVQSAMLAPTSILAEQHYQNMLKLLSEDLNSAEETGALLKSSEIALLIGATPEAEKKGIREKLANGEIKLIIGTHALIEDPIVFADLQLVIVDEQHRFGVEQRATLRSKGDNPHLLVMTATPIPRSLALTIYGDLDLSVMDEMPPGRQAVETHILFPRERERAYSLIRSQLEEGRQAFIVYPLIEDNGGEANQEAGRGAVEEYTRLQKEIFPDFHLGLLHGRMKADEKEAVMALFRNKEVHILVSTTVVEVGVDFPNATVMMVEGANRFGLSQLHQLRGRVGRGQDKAYCLLIPETPDLVEKERLAAMAETTDGFVLAERDLEQRGPGDFLGTRQSGYRSELRMASLTDVRLIEKARQQAQGIFATDPGLDLPENQLLSQVLQNYWGPGEEITTKGDIS